ncbi:hypothetical protein [Nakamurella endophytica]|uniref:Proteasome subunit beta n=1 Tax=Nakamurella endophytica TaxID=1748367 RepID=A0A917T182_9ACTN|nr:hypothetical protein [Nakamurella endophytica]GGM04651.1 hypothetical protein GCM10011594_26130 [Nakamurella endophytica]
MTVAVGLVCRDGVLVASDSMATDSQQVAMRSVKVRCVAGYPIIWTGAGSVYTLEEVAAELQTLEASSGSGGQPVKSFTEPNLSAVRAKLQGLIHKGMKRAYGTALTTNPNAQGQNQILPGFGANLLVLGYSASVPWFLEFDQTGVVNWHTEHSFYATGSGGSFATVALSLMRHHVTSDLSLEQGMLLAYRTIDTTIEVSTFGVGPPVQMAICDAGGARVLSSDEVEQVRIGVDRWKELERETLLIGQDDGTPDSVSNDLPELDA